MKNISIILVLVFLSSCNAGKYYFNKRISHDENFIVDQGSCEEVSKTPKVDSSFTEVDNKNASEQNFTESTKQASDNINESENLTEVIKETTPQKIQATEIVSEKKACPHDPVEQENKFKTVTTKGSLKKYVRENEKAIDDSDAAKYEADNGDIIAGIIIVGLILALLFYAYSILGSLLFTIIGFILLGFLGIFVLAGIFWALNWLVTQAGLEDLI